MEEFLKEALAKLESREWIRRVRAEAGFFAEELLRYLEDQKLGYIGVARLTPWLRREAARVTEWRELDETYAVGEFRLKLLGWERERRFAMVREKIQEKKSSLGRKLFEVPGYTFRIFVTNLEDQPEEIWRDYNQRACGEQRIEELKSDLAADDFCLKEFFATEAAFLSILMLFNLLAEFQRATAMTAYRQPATLRVQVFLCGALLGRAGHRPVLHLSETWGRSQNAQPAIGQTLTLRNPNFTQVGNPNATGVVNGTLDETQTVQKLSPTYEFGFISASAPGVYRYEEGSALGRTRRVFRKSEPITILPPARSEA